MKEERKGARPPLRLKLLIFFLAASSPPSVSLDMMLPGLVTINMRTAPICSVQVDAINLQIHNSPDLYPKFQSLSIRVVKDVTGQGIMH